jgi:predicted DCC family thiol-disulfide oxidoreductase YuxK
MGSPGSLGNHEPILVLFDGVCNLCNGLVQFIIKRDPAAKFRFASLQSDVGRTQLLKYNLSPDYLYSLIVIHKDKALERSDAALYIAKSLAQPWRVLYVFRVLPKFLRDGFYDLVARNRYTLFGRRQTCMIPSPDLRDRFLEQD